MTSRSIASMHNMKLPVGEKERNKEKKKRERFRKNLRENQECGQSNAMHTNGIARGPDSCHALSSPRLASSRLRASVVAVAGNEAAVCLSRAAEEKK